MRTTLSLSWDELSVGQEFQTPSRTITESDVGLFAGLTGDHAEHHTSRVVAAAAGHDVPLAHGLLVLSCAHGLLLGDGLLRGSVQAFLGLREWSMTAPVHVGDTIHVLASIQELRVSRSNSERGIAVMRLEVRNQDDVVVQAGSKSFYLSTSANSEVGS